MDMISVLSHCYFIYEHHSSVAQLVEQAAVNRLVGGSSPSRGANNIKGLSENRLTLFHFSELLSELFFKNITMTRKQEVKCPNHSTPTTNTKELQATNP